MKRLIAVRRQTRVFGRGSITFLYPENRRVLAFVRTFEGEQVLVVANLAHLAQTADLDLRAYHGMRPVELFGHTAFPAIDDRPYRITLGPYDFFWFRLEAPTTPEVGETAGTIEPVVIARPGEWASLERPEVRATVEGFLARYLPTQRWYRGKALLIERVRWAATLPLSSDGEPARLALIETSFSDAEPQTYLLPLSIADAGPPAAPSEGTPGHVIAAFRPAPASPERLLYDVAQEPEFVRRLVGRIGRNRRRRVDDLELAAVRTSAFQAGDETSTETLPIQPLRGEQSNSSAKVGDRYVLKVFRLVEAGRNPEIELGQFLLRHGPAPVAPLAGYLELLNARGETYTLASLHRYVPNEGDAWGMTLDHLRGYFDRARAHFGGPGHIPTIDARGIDLGATELPRVAIDLVGGYGELARQLGRRTAEFHRALASEPVDPTFAPAPFDQMYVRSIFQTMQSQRQQVFGLLRATRDRLAEPAGTLADELLRREETVDARFRRLLGRPYDGQRIRIHGDYHLGQVLWTGRDFVVIDLEGEPLRPLSERRLKRSPLRDVAGMLRSFDYAARTAAKEIPLVGGPLPAERDELLALADLWVGWTTTAFLQGYREGCGAATFLPRDRGEFRLLLEAYTMEKAIYEVGYELNNRPAWAEIPLRGLLHLLGPEG